MPRFDSPSVFGRILDRERGGVFRVLAGDQEIAGELDYVRNTNVTKIRFERGELLAADASRAGHVGEWDTPLEAKRLQMAPHGRGFDALCHTGEV